MLGQVVRDVMLDLRVGLWYVVVCVCVVDLLESCNCRIQHELWSGPDEHCRQVASTWKNVAAANAAGLHLIRCRVVLLKFDCPSLCSATSEWPWWCGPEL